MSPESKRPPGQIVFRHLSCEDWGTKNPSGRQKTRNDSGGEGAKRTGNQCRSTGHGRNHSGRRPRDHAQRIRIPGEYSEPDAAQEICKRVPQIPVATAHQVQMLSSFLEVHFPSRAAKADLSSRGSWLMALPDVDLSTSPMLKHALDTVCFAHLGSINHDARLQLQSRAAYGRVLNLIVHDLNRPQRQNESRHILASIMLLCLYDDSIPRPRSSIDGWTAHYHGAQQFLGALGPSKVDMTNAFDRLMFNNLRMPGIFLGIARRKATILSENSWQTMAEGASHSLPSRVKLYSLALEIPGLLEKTEAAIMLEHADVEHIARLFQDIFALQHRLQHWLRNQSSVKDEVDSIYDDMVAVTDSGAFDSNVEEQLLMTTNPTISAFYNLGKTISEYSKVEDFSLFWQFSLILDCALLRILHFDSAAADHLDNLSPKEVKRNAFQNATHICRAIYSNSRVYSSSQGMTGHIDGLAGIAQNFFSEVGAAQEAGWCQAIRLAVRLRRNRMRSTAPRSLCRMPDIAEEIAAAGLFKTRRLQIET